MVWRSFPMASPSPTSRQRAWPKSGMCAKTVASRLNGKSGHVPRAPHCVEPKRRMDCRQLRSPTASPLGIGQRASTPSRFVRSPARFGHWRGTRQANIWLSASRTAGWLFGTWRRSRKSLLKPVCSRSRKSALSKSGSLRAALKSLQRVRISMHDVDRAASQIDEPSVFVSIKCVTFSSAQTIVPHLRAPPSKPPAANGSKC